MIALVLARAVGPLSDPDVWWHVRTGRLILEMRSVPDSDPWSFTAHAGSWVPTAWLSDVLFALLWSWGSWDAIRILRSVMACAVIVAIWLAAGRAHTVTAPAAMATALSVLAVAPFLRERPQVLSFLFVAYLAVLADKILKGQTPALRTCVPLCWLWANVHGMWILLPGILLVCGVLAWIDDRNRVGLAARCCTGAICCMLVTLLTPVGPRLTLWPFVVRDVATPISEWQPTLPLSPLGAPVVLALVVIVVAWLRAGERPTMGGLLYAGGLGIFAMMALRNVAPAAILLTPMLTRAFDSLLPDLRWRRTLPVPTAAALLVIAVTGSALGGFYRFQATPAFHSKLPLKITAELAQRPAPVRVLNSYDVGGLLTGLATPNARVAIDGRTDMWSASYVSRYLVDISGGGDWRALVDELRPDVAVLPARNEVTHALQQERGWVVALKDGDWVLLEPPPKPSHMWRNDRPQ